MRCRTVICEPGCGSSASGEWGRVWDRWVGMHTKPRRFGAFMAAGLALICAAGVSVAPALAATAGPTSVRIIGGPTSDADSRPISLDATIYLPAKTPAPAVVLAHGFGGSKEAVADQAKRLADAGFVVMAYSARGFGNSIGKISMNAPQFEVADALAVIDYLATRSEVLLDKPGDPRVGVAGRSYGGALALLAGGYDQRIDAIAADITWNDLQSALFPQSVVGSGAVGVFKQLWTSYFFSSGLLPIQGGAPSLCGRFSLAWCNLYLQAVESGTVTPAAAAIMRASSPASIADRITAPTLLSAGLADSLFPLAQADATARQIESAHPATPLKMVWHSGGHDGGVSEESRLEDLVRDWFTVHLSGKGKADTGFEVTFVKGSLLARRSNNGPDIQRASTYPGLQGSSRKTVPLSGRMQPVLAPAGGLPAAISVLPGVGSVSAFSGGAAQHLAVEGAGAAEQREHRAAQRRHPALREPGHPLEEHVEGGVGQQRLERTDAGVVGGARDEGARGLELVERGGRRRIEEAHHRGRAGQARSGERKDTLRVPGGGLEVAAQAGPLGVPSREEERGVERERAGLRRVRPLRGAQGLHVGGGERGHAGVDGRTVIEE